MKTKLIDFLNESRNKEISTDSMLLYKNIIDKYSDNIYVDKPHDRYYETIDISIKNPSILNDIIAFIEKNNWYISDENLFDSKGRIEIKPIWSKGIVEVIPSKLYHATPTRNVKNILSNGLKAKSDDIRHKYPNRIYVCGKKEILYPLIKELKSWKNDEYYSIIEIDTKNLDIKLYTDITSAYLKTYYIQGIKVIKPEYLTVVENNL